MLYAPISRRDVGMKRCRAGATPRAHGNPACEQAYSGLGGGTIGALGKHVLYHASSLASIGFLSSLHWGFGGGEDLPGPWARTSIAAQAPVTGFVVPRLIETMCKAPHSLGQ